MAIYKFYLKIHTEKSCYAIVSIGDDIVRGELIAESMDLDLKIHSSVKGRVLEINDEEISIDGDICQTEDFKKIKRCSSIAEYAKEAGIIGAGGAGFPTYLKLKTLIPNGNIIANCVECEPGLKHNVELLKNEPELVIKGIKYAMDSTMAKKAYIGIKEKNSTAIKAINAAIKSLEYTDIQVVLVKDIYPMGEERALIHAIFGEWISPNDRPITLNSIVLNTETLANLTRAVEYRKPVIDKDITIIGDFKNKDKENVYFNVPIGTSVKELIKEYEIKYPVGEFIMGGPYIGVSKNLETAVITKTTGGLIFTIPLPIYEGPIGLLVCACGANEERLREIALKMGSTVKAVAFCKNIANNGKCMTPGVCPGQVERILFLKRENVKRVLISNCMDCSNTVMCCAPKLGLGVYHATDHIFRTIDYPLTRRL
ncbi:proline reductase-associated electron transfer protein PrdC [Cetobacterium sp.]|uniref:proline reductase-associated electron transfer protein PrdC n=1 Tax=Cetobacterium sp. TaxID=2071632 RepID=UPI003AEF6375